MEVRPVESHEDFRACVDLQRVTWGAEFTDIVPTSLLKISMKVGGLVAGAFGPDHTLVGFVYGLTGMNRGKLLHWSHMLAVRKEARNQGVGTRLKHFQKEWLQERGVNEMRWTFDPLVARNAHINLTVLGVQILEYVPDMYAATGSGLHSFGTDRFIVSWRFGALDAPDCEAGFRVEPSSLPNVFPGHHENAPPRGRTPFPNATAVKLPVPSDVETLSEVCLDEAVAWRRITRPAFLHYQERGYRVAGFRTGDGGPFYILCRSG